MGRRPREGLIVLVLPSAAAALAGAAGLAASSRPWLAVAAATAAVAALVALATLTAHHLRALRRVADILAGLAAGAGVRSPSPHIDGAGPALSAALAAGLGLSAARPAGQGAPDPRLARIVAGLPLPVLALTATGLVTLANGPARRLLGAAAVAPGTSVLDAVDRASLGAALAAARAGAGPVEAVLDATDGRRLPARVADLGEQGGALVTFAADVGWEPWLGHAFELLDRPPPPGPVDENTPLARLPVAVIDLETTGLDPMRDRAVSVAGVRIHGDRLYGAVTLDRLVRPDVPIPRTATAIHGIADATVADAPTVAAVLPEVAEFVAGCVVVGHNIGFDLAVLAAEARRTGVAWGTPPSLCLLQLVDVLEPGWTNLDLDSLAAHFAVPVTGRHTALGDALVTAELYIRLLPRLAAAGVATWGEAAALAARSRRARRLQAAAGW
ncbi:MAG: 3'-5' exonuclease [Alphaproteobacteria bacterium]|nr:3'-5' exonuclease [Alphaproteobacteria bacterium]